MSNKSESQQHGEYSGQSIKHLKTDTTENIHEKNEVPPINAREVRDTTHNEGQRHLRRPILVQDPEKIARVDISRSLYTPDRFLANQQHINKCRTANFIQFTKYVAIKYLQKLEHSTITIKKPGANELARNIFKRKERLIVNRASSALLVLTDSRCKFRSFASNSLSSSFTDLSIRLNDEIPDEASKKKDLEMSSKDPSSKLMLKSQLSYNFTLPIPEKYQKKTYSPDSDACQLISFISKSISHVVQNKMKLVRQSSELSTSTPIPSASTEASRNKRSNFYQQTRGQSYEKKSELKYVNSECKVKHNGGITESANENIKSIEKYKLRRIKFNKYRKRFLSKIYTRDFTQKYHTYFAALDYNILTLKISKASRQAVGTGSSCDFNNELCTSIFPDISVNGEPRGQVNPTDKYYNMDTLVLPTSSKSKRQLYECSTGFCNPGACGSSECFKRLRKAAPYGSHASMQTPQYEIQEQKVITGKVYKRKSASKRQPFECLSGVCIPDNCEYFKHLKYTAPYGSHASTQSPKYEIQEPDAIEGKVFKRNSASLTKDGTKSKQTATQQRRITKGIQTQAIPHRSATCIASKLSCSVTRKSEPGVCIPLDIENNIECDRGVCVPGKCKPKECYKRIKASLVGTRTDKSRAGSRGTSHGSQTSVQSHKHKNNKNKKDKSNTKKLMQTLKIPDQQAVSIGSKCNCNINLNKAIPAQSGDYSQELQSHKNKKSHKKLPPQVPKPLKGEPTVCVPLDTGKNLECDHGVCVPGKCKPKECYKRIKASLVGTCTDKSRNSSLGTSHRSQTSTHSHKLNGNNINKYISSNSKPEQTLNIPDRQTVSIGSTCNSNINCNKDTHAQPSNYTNKMQPHENKKMNNLPPVALKPSECRSLDTGKNIECVPGVCVPGECVPKQCFKRLKASLIGTTRTHKSKAISVCIPLDTGKNMECDPGVCIPGKCKPKECFKRIKASHVDPRADKSKASCRGMSHSRQTSTQSNKHKNNNIKQDKSSTAKPMQTSNIPVSIGSTCNCNINCIKDMPSQPGNYTYGQNMQPHQNEKKNNLKPKAPKPSDCKPGVPIPLDTGKNIECCVPGVCGLGKCVPKECFKRLKASLIGRRTHQSKAISVCIPLDTRKNIECDPGVCVPGKCKPKECFKRIKASNVDPRVHESKASCRGISYGRQTSTQSNNQKNNNIKKDKSSTAKPKPTLNIPDQQAISIRSTCNSNINCNKDMPAQPGNYAQNMQPHENEKKNNLKPKALGIKPKSFECQPGDCIPLDTGKNIGCVPGVCVLGKCVPIECFKRIKASLVGTRTHNSRAISVCIPPNTEPNIQCDPGVCIPGKCKPKECFRRIKALHAGTRADKPRTISHGTCHSSQTFTQSQELNKSNINKDKSSTAKPKQNLNIPDRQPVSIGSTCNSNITCNKDMPAQAGHCSQNMQPHDNKKKTNLPPEGPESLKSEPAVYVPLDTKKNIECHPGVCCVPKECYKRIKASLVGTPTYKSRAVSRGTSHSCQTSVQLHKHKKYYNKQKLPKGLNPMKGEPTVGATLDTGNNMECDPGVCVPGKCKPRECYEVIKASHVGTRTNKSRASARGTSHGSQTSVHTHKHKNNNIKKDISSTAKPKQTLNIPDRQAVSIKTKCNSNINKPMPAQTGNYPQNMHPSENKKKNNLPPEALNPFQGEPAVSTRDDRKIIKCDSGICVPSKCIPKDCYKRVKAKSVGTRTDKSGTSSRGTAHSSQTSTQSNKHENNNIKNDVSRTAMANQTLNSPDRQAVRIGSKCSFDVEFYKAMLAHPGNYLQNMQSHENKKKYKLTPTRLKKTKGKAGVCLPFDTGTNIECDTDVCVPGERVPKKSYKQIKTSHVGTRTNISSSSSRGTSHSSQTSAQPRKQKKNNNKKDISTTIKVKQTLKVPDRQAVRIGSKCSFNVEFYKAMHAPSGNYAQNVQPYENKVNSSYSDQLLRYERKPKSPLKALKPFECEPKICKPGKCSPIKCGQRIKDRQVSTGSNTSLAGSTNTTSHGSQASTKTGKDNKLRENKGNNYKFKGTSSMPRPKSLLYIPNRQAVRIGSKCSFNVEFYKAMHAHPNNYAQKEQPYKNLVKSSYNNNISRHGRQHKSPLNAPKSFECEPKVCTPGKCSPIKCGQRIKDRQATAGSDNSIAGSSNTKSHGSQASTRTGKGKDYQLREKKGTNYKYKGASSMPRPKSLLHIPNRQVVHIGSKCRFNIDFYKTMPAQPGNYAQNMQLNENKGKKKSQLEALMPLKSDPGVSLSLNSEKNIKCKPGVCVPAECDPKECYKQINASHVGTPTYKSSTSYRGTSHSSQTSAKSHKQKKDRNKKDISSTANPKQTMNIPNRQAVRIGSKCSFNVEFYKAMPAHPGNYAQHMQPREKTVTSFRTNKFSKYGRKNMSSLKAFECEPGVCIPGKCSPIKCGQRIKARQVTTGSNTSLAGSSNTTSHGSQASTKTGKAKDYRLREKKGTYYKDKGASSMPRAKNLLHIPNRQAVRIGSKCSFNVEFYKTTHAHPGNYGQNMQSNEINGKNMSPLKAIDTRKKIECDPGVCVPGECVPTECFERIKASNVGTRKHKSYASSRGTSHSSQTSTQSRKRKNNNNKKDMSSTAKPKQTLNIPKRQAVRIGSKCSFNLEFYKATLAPPNKYAQNMKPYENQVKSSSSNKFSRHGRKYKSPLKALKPFECEPKVCTPGKCSPNKCRQRIRDRQVTAGSNNSLAGSSNTTSHGSQASTKRSNGKDYQLRGNKGTYYKDKGASSMPRPKSLLHIPNRQAVRIGSICSFNVEFYKAMHSHPENYAQNMLPHENKREKKAPPMAPKSLKYEPEIRLPLDTGKNIECDLGVCVPSECDPKECYKRIISSNLGSLQHKSYTSSRSTSHSSQTSAQSRKHKNNNNKKDTSSSTANPKKILNIPNRQAVRIGSKCSFNVEFYKAMPAHPINYAQNVQTHEKKVTSWRTNKFSRYGRKNKSLLKALKAFQCVPGDCIPGKCYPIECYQRIKARHGTVGSDTSDGSQASAKMGKSKDYQLKGTTGTYYKDKGASSMPRSKNLLHIPNRQAVRIGSECSLDIEFYKGLPHNVHMPNNQPAKAIKPHECEPGVCIPGKCDPNECFLILKTRHEGNGTDVTSHESQFSNKMHRNKTQVMRKTKTSFYKNKGAPSIRHPKIQLRDVCGFKDQEVRIGSNCSFNIEFYKSTPRYPNFNEPNNQSATAEGVAFGASTTTATPAAHGKKSKVTKKYVCEPGVCIPGKCDPNECMGRFLTGTPEKKRYTCEPGVCVPGKCHPNECMARFLTAAPGKKRYTCKPGVCIPGKCHPNECMARFFTGASGRKSFVCEPGVCIPGKCDPNECIARLITKQGGTRNHASLESTSISKSYDSQASTQTKKKEKTNRRKRAGKETFYKDKGASTFPRSKMPLHVPNRQVVRIGSKCSFNLEFYKDMTKKGLKESNGKQIITSQFPKQNTKITEMGTALKSIECEPSVCVPSKCNPKECYQRLTGTPLVQAPIKCEPGVCVPSKCDPKECYQRLTGTPFVQPPIKCEPGVCVPSKCDPKECYQRLTATPSSSSGTSSKDQQNKAWKTIGTEKRSKEIKGKLKTKKQSPPKYDHGDAAVQHKVSTESKRKKFEKITKPAKSSRQQVKPTKQQQDKPTKKQAKPTKQQAKTTKQHDQGDSVEPSPSQVNQDDKHNVKLKKRQESTSTDASLASSSEVASQSKINRVSLGKNNKSGRKIRAGKEHYFVKEKGTSNIPNSNKISKEDLARQPPPRYKQKNKQVVRIGSTCRFNVAFYKDIPATGSKNIVTTSESLETQTRDQQGIVPFFKKCFCHVKNKQKYVNSEQTLMLYEQACNTNERMSNWNNLVCEPGICTYGECNPNECRQRVKPTHTSQNSIRPQFTAPRRRKNTMRRFECKFRLCLPNKCVPNKCFETERFSLTDAGTDTSPRAKSTVDYSNYGTNVATQSRRFPALYAALSPIRGTGCKCVAKIGPSSQIRQQIQYLLAAQKQNARGNNGLYNLNTGPTRCCCGNNFGGHIHEKEVILGSGCNFNFKYFGKNKKNKRK